MDGRQGEGVRDTGSGSIDGWLIIATIGFLGNKLFTSILLICHWLMLKRILTWICLISSICLLCKGSNIKPTGIVLRLHRGWRRCCWMHNSDDAFCIICHHPLLERGGPPYNDPRMSTPIGVYSLWRTPLWRRCSSWRTTLWITADTFWAAALPWTPGTTHAPSLSMSRGQGRRRGWWIDPTSGWAEPVWENK